MKPLLLLLLLAAAPARAVDFTLTVATSGPVTPLAVITSTPAGIVCPGTCEADFASGTSVTLGVVVPSTVAFVSWGAPCRSNLPTCVLTLRADTDVNALFAPLLKVGFSGNGIGTVAISSQAAFSNTGSAAVRAYVYPLGATVVLTASTGTGSAFVGWSGDGGCERASTCTVTLNGYELIVATFSASSAAYPLRVSVPMGGGTVTSSPAGISCPGTCSANFAANASVTLTTAASSGYRFAGWANGGCAKLQTCVVTSTSPLQGLGGRFSPAAFFYPNP